MEWTIAICFYSVNSNLLLFSSESKIVIALKHVGQPVRATDEKKPASAGMEDGRKKARAGRALSGCCGHASRRPGALEVRSASERRSLSALGGQQRPLEVSAQHCL